jgi:hypothetical protein
MQISPNHMNLKINDAPYMEFGWSDPLQGGKWTTITSIEMTEYWTLAFVFLRLCDDVCVRV